MVENIKEFNTEILVVCKKLRIWFGQFEGTQKQGGHKGGKSESFSGVPRFRVHKTLLNRNQKDGK